MTALATVVAPTLVKEPEGLEVAWTQVANADQYTITMYPQTPKTSSDYDLAESTKVVSRVAGTGATTELVGSPANKLQAGILYKATITAHQVSGANTDSTSAATTTAVKASGATGAAAGTSGETAHSTTNPFTGAAYASAGQTKGQVTYARVGGVVTQTTVDATTSVGATAAARDTADLPSADMQQTIIPDEGDTQAGEGGGKTLVSDIVSSTGTVTINPSTGAMTANSLTEVAPALANQGTRVDRLLHEIDHTKNTVSATGVAS
jgi:hypothetical protein